MIAVKRILVPTDFSPTSDAALKYAIGLAQTFDARIFLLHVPGPTGENFEADFPVEAFDAVARERFGSFVSPQEAVRLKPEYALRIGTPAEQIVRYAGDRDIDLIVMGTHGRTGMAHMLMGSVAEQVVRRAPCPVLMIRRAEQPSAAQEVPVVQASRQPEPAATQLT